MSSEHTAPNRSKAVNLGIKEREKGRHQEPVWHCAQE